MNTRYFAFTIKDPRSHITLSKVVKRAAYGVFDAITATVESRPYQHVHVLAASASPEPNIERFCHRCPPITWAQELDEQAAQRFHEYILAQGRHSEKNCGTHPLIISDSFL
jgi:hypothetical protein